jgi:SAM-dependent methyltransferase
MPWWGWLLTGTALVAGIYWLAVLTEGAYLGPQAVLALYDHYATRYDRTKGFDPDSEALFLGRPLSRALIATTPTGQRPVLLDVATGTGRLPLAVLRASPAGIEVIALDGSLGMLREAQEKLAAWPKTVFVHSRAERLPFASSEFAAVTCLEALEFMPDHEALLAEMWRVLRPGGILLITNRIGWQSWLMPGKSLRPQTLVALVESMGAVGVDYRPWQVDYDLVTAYKPGVARRPPAVWPDLVACKRCTVWPLPTQEDVALVCPSCGWTLAQCNGIWSDAGWTA